LEWILGPVLPEQKWWLSIQAIIRTDGTNTLSSN